MTPDELREWANRLEPREGFDSTADTIRYFSDQWAASELRLKKEAINLLLEVARLLERLEAAEKLLRWCNGPIKAAHYNLSRMEEEIATLKEKP